MSAVIIRLRVFIAHERFGGERFVAAFPRDRVGELITRLLLEAGIEEDPRKWELCDGDRVVFPDLTVGEILGYNRAWSNLTLQRTGLERGTSPAQSLLASANDSDIHKSDLLGSVLDIPMKNDSVESGALAIGAPERSGGFTGILLRKNIISAEQLAEAENIAKLQGIAVQDALTKLQYATPAQCMAAIAESRGLQFVDLSSVEIPRALIELVPESVARENVVLPLSLDGRTLKIITSNADSYETVQKLQFILNLDIVTALAMPEQIQDAINRHYGQTETESVDSLLVEFTDTAIEFTQTQSLNSAPEPEPEPPAAKPPTGAAPPPGALPGSRFGPDATTGRYVIDGDVDFELALNEPSNSPASPEGAAPAAPAPEAPTPRQEEASKTDCEVPRDAAPKGADADLADAEFEENDDVGIPLTGVSMRKEETPAPQQAPPAPAPSIPKPAPVIVPAPVPIAPPVTRAAPAPSRPRSAPTRAKVAVDRMAAPGKVLSTTERRATVRYYSRMNPDRVFPLLVMLTRQEVEEIVKKYVEQKATGPLTIAKDVPLEIEPVLPGCQCHPPKVTTILGNSDDVFTFHIVPHVLGEVTGARVFIRQDHKILAEIKLDMNVVQRTMVVASGLSTFVVPAASAVMKHFKVDLTPKDGSSPYLALLNFLYGQTSPLVLTLVLALVTLALWWFTRPKGRDVFWDITTKPPATGGK